MLHVPAFVAFFDLLGQPAGSIKKIKSVQEDDGVIFVGEIEPFT